MPANILSKFIGDQEIFMIDSFEISYQPGFDFETILDISEMMSPSHASLE